MNTSDQLSPGEPFEKIETRYPAGGPLKINSTLLGATLVAALGGLLFGFDTIVISGCQAQLKALFQLNSFQQGFMTASAIIGTVMGALAAARPGDRYGRRDSLKVAGLLYLCPGVRAGLGFLAVDHFPDHRWDCGGGLIRFGAVVPGRNFSRPVAWTPGGLFSIQHRAGSAARLCFKFRSRDAGHG